MLARWPDGRHVLVENHNSFVQWKEKFCTGEELPVTTWDKAFKTLTINLQDETIDTAIFNRGADNRTRIQFARH
jgi:hypothetical protein